MTTYTYEITAQPSGYGYQVSADGELLIDQPFDPAAPFVNGEGQPYQTFALAESAAAQVVAEAQAQVVEPEVMPGPEPAPVPDLPPTEPEPEPTPEP